MSDLDEARAIYEEWEERVVHTAWRQGYEAGRKKAEEAARKKAEEADRLQTLREILRSVYQAQFGALRPAVQAAIESTEDIDTLQQWVAPFATATPEELATLVCGR